jgi:hypothetical protein
MSVGNVVTTADAQRINQYVLGTQTMTGFDFYSSKTSTKKNEMFKHYANYQEIKAGN